MDVPVSEAKAQLTELVRRAEAGEDVVLTRHGHPVARLTPVKTAMRTAPERKAALAALIASWASEPSPGPDAARSQDFLYDEAGLPK